MNTTHIEVTAANRGAEIFGLRDGQLIRVTNETPKFFFCDTPSGRTVKVSKHTGRACSWAQQNNSPVFNV